ncbi:MAG: lanthionine synthetase C family protein [Mariniphaga sp.]|nr:lanthionine synthetase C family protein [Mariniphaga sp.]
MTNNIQEKIEEIWYLIKSKEVNKIGLFGGELGSLLFFFNYFKFFRKKTSLEYIENNLNILFSTPAPNQFSFSSGYAGLGWLMEYFYRGGVLKTPPNELFAHIDPFLGKWMINEMEKGNYDFLHGACGTALYFIAGLPHGKSELYLNDFVIKLNHKAVREIDGSVKWEVVLNFKSFQKGYNISLSHGIPSIINILCKLYKLNICRDVCFDLLAGAIKYIQKQKLPQKKFISIYPSWALESTTALNSSRLAWCYGDLGIAVTFWNAAQVLNDKELESESIEILLHSCKRLDLKSNHVIDAVICHGSAGISHIFKRMYVNTKIPEFNEAANYWIEKTLEFAKYNDGFAGYKAWYPESRGGLKPVLSLLEGISGIGLALLSNISEEEPVWDECLLLS